LIPEKHVGLAKAGVAQVRRGKGTKKEKRGLEPAPPSLPQKKKKKKKKLPLPTPPKQPLPSPKKEGGKY